MGKDEPEAARAPVDTARAIVCAVCGAEITDSSLRIERLGLHVHRCVNPAGMEYQVACFAAARGLLVASNRSSEWSWFPGYQWQIEVCAGCKTHLGWRYSRGDESFHGLVVDRLRE
jgi:hypothetical protein